MDDQVIVDADAFYALISPIDSNHNKAVRINKLLVKNKTAFITTNLVIYEVATLLSHRKGQDTAIKFLNDWIKYPSYIYPVYNELEVVTFKIFKQQTKKNTSITDCANMALMKKLGLATIFSFDKTYQKNGFKRAGIID